MTTLVQDIGEYSVPADTWMLLVWTVQKNNVTTKYGSLTKGPSAGRRAAIPQLIIGGEQELRDYAASNEIRLPSSGGMKEQ